MPTRREFLKTSAGGLVLAGMSPLSSSAAWAAGESLGPPELPDGTLAASTLEALPGKLPLIKKSFRPPNFETPINYFNEPFTPNKAFFVRYHLSNIPEVSAKDWRLKVGGESVDKPFELTLDNLHKDFEI